MGVKKPNKAFFDFATERMRGVEGMPLFFDDTPRVVEGARSYGWETVLFNDVNDFRTHPWIAERLK